MPLKNIVYLIGAGATHAEILNLEKSPNEKFLRKYGLIISNVSKRVESSQDRCAVYRDVIFQHTEFSKQKQKIIVIHGNN